MNSKQPCPQSKISTLEAWHVTIAQPHWHQANWVKSRFQAVWLPKTNRVPPSSSGMLHGCPSRRAGRSRHHYLWQRNPRAEIVKGGHHHIRPALGRGRAQDWWCPKDTGLDSQDRRLLWIFNYLCACWQQGTNQQQWGGWPVSSLLPIYKSIS